MIRGTDLRSGMEMQTMASQAAELKMPQAGGATREPSMEEILASIRRIIEDSDQGRKPEGGATPDASTPGAEAEAVAMIAANAPAPRFDLPGQARPAIEEPAAVSRRPEAVREAPAQSAQAMRSETMPSVERTDPELNAAEPATPDRMFEARDSADAATVEMADEPAVADRMDTTPVQPVPAPVEKASLISERTGRQVAAAFGELSEAFEASRRKSFDELAAEMMRPMLQDWLDNNLPTLVERLVREEIERVARGGR